MLLRVREALLSDHCLVTNQCRKLAAFFARGGAGAGGGADAAEAPAARGACDEAPAEASEASERARGTGSDVTAKRVTLHTTRP